MNDENAANCSVRSSQNLLAFVNPPSLVSGFSSKLIGVQNLFTVSVDNTVVDDLHPLDWLKSGNLLSSAPNSTEKKPKLQTGTVLESSHTICSAGCFHSLDERTNEDLHPLSWLQANNLLPIAPIDSDDECHITKVGSFATATSLPRVEKAITSVNVVDTGLESLSNQISSETFNVCSSVTESSIESPAVCLQNLTENGRIVVPDLSKVHRVYIVKPNHFSGLKTRKCALSVDVCSVTDSIDITAEVGSKRPRGRRVDKPVFTYAQLAFMAIESSPSKAFEFYQIYDWCKTNFPSYNIDNRLKPCIRHILSRHPSFKRNPQFGTRGALWTIDPEMREKLLHSLRFVAVDETMPFSADVERLLQLAEQSFFHPVCLKAVNPLDQ